MEAPTWECIISINVTLLASWLAGCIFLINFKSGDGVVYADILHVILEIH